MAILIDGQNKTIILSELFTFDARAIYRACVDWSVLSNNMKYILPMISGGHFGIASSVYSDDIYVLQHNYKLQPYGYPENTQIDIIGTITTSDNSSRAVYPTVGYPVQFVFTVSTNGTLAIVSTGSGLSPEQNNQIMNIIATKRDTNNIRALL